MSTIFDHKHIVLCGDHYNPLGIVRSLGEEGIKPIVVLVGKHAYLVNHSSYVGVLHRVLTNEEGLNLIIEKYGHEPIKPFIYTGSDDTTELLDQHYDELIDHFYFFNDGKQGLLTFYNHKTEQLKIANAAGINIPKSQSLKTGVLPSGLKYPVLTKVIMSTQGAWKDDVFICKNKQQLAEAYKHIKAEEILVQEFVEKQNELCVDGVSIDGGKEVFISYTSEYIRFTKKSYGDYFWMKQYNNEIVKEKIRNIIKATHYSGIFCLECLIDKSGELYFLETNFRNSGWSYAHTCGGVNLPIIWAKSTLAGHIPTDEIKMENRPYKAMVEPSELLSSVVRERQVSLWQWIKDVRSCKCHIYYNKKDKLPLLTFVWGRFLTALRNRF